MRKRSPQQRGWAQSRHRKYATCAGKEVVVKHLLSGNRDKTDVRDWVFARAK